MDASRRISGVRNRIKSAAIKAVELAMKQPMAAMSGTVAVGAIGVEPGDEIIVTPWTMCASATAILHWNAIGCARCCISF